ncbi:coproporphyrinogen III oxidase [Sinorhizobium fredii USDA 205]|uniref:Coproporphyrinogen-III oxidase n=1 Tax=Rhizobium fredii TaxID=380 RepID=A0A844AC98_RHIFR|nr:oxygen-independent coproporphyrinogen III oxidase [Sinorhizobium fredii]KSV90296.1 coproporphyrinogen III oxidase [Sinorhizobium fredii USDA 205]MQW96653.1 oxygen-independent coproporphyrinogen III oxidase [Sinorhizobium fredii]MQX09732.1 oxygen-independent coproporphyrinogen III oxidase [Sinorhizobium fredii]UTY48839.1 oxygen-independent coproporphyrinogen III oxidase [Sinorhizobium fredii]GEC29932.1 coproporphyrinogen-III oxidase [Sinorhizobium fredii]
MQPSLVAKYGEARLPRYTSYPTAPRFSPAIDVGTYGDWLAATPLDKPASLYLHIPFCRSMCWYCGCHTTITQRDQPILDYLDMLREEIGVVAARTKAPLNIDHVHFGGGTPTIMRPEEMLALVRLLRERFDFADTAEIAVEIDPRTLEQEMATALGEAGVRRASLGVQSFDPVVQMAINRVQSEEQTLEAVSRLRRAGVDSINFDLIYGLPHQTVESCIATAEAAIAMGPDRFAVFGYAHIPSFKKHQKLIDEAALANAEGRVAQAEAIAATLIAAGYRRIGLDHFARPDDSLALAQENGQLHRNFQGYTTDACETLIGFGASAIGRMTAGYVQNEIPPGVYAQRIASGRLATVKGYSLTAEDRLRANVIERLMCDFRVDVPAIAAAHGFDPQMLLHGNAKLAMLESDGVLENVGGVIRLHDEGRFLIRAVAAAFDAYLEQSARTHSKAA